MKKNIPAYVEQYLNIVQTVKTNKDVKLLNKSAFNSIHVNDGEKGENDEEHIKG